VILALMVLVTISVTVFVAIVRKACCTLTLHGVRDTLGSWSTSNEVERRHGTKGGWMPIVSQQIYQLSKDQMTASVLQLWMITRDSNWVPPDVPRILAFRVSLKKDGTEITAPHGAE
jgi:hypothetical protein